MPRLDDQHVRLRSEVVRLRSSARRRVCNVTVHVGVVGRPSDSFVVGESALPAMDASLRADVVSELLQRSGDDSDMLWIWRPGTPHLHDLDLEWTSAAGLAFGAHARVLRACYAITWTGWLDIRSGESRIWKRLRV